MGKLILCNVLMQMLVLQLINISPTALILISLIKFGEEMFAWFISSQVH